MGLLGEPRYQRDDARQAAAAGSAPLARQVTSHFYLTLLFQNICFCAFCVMSCVLCGAYLLACACV